MQCSITFKGAVFTRHVNISYSDSECSLSINGDEVLSFSFSTTLSVDLDSISNAITTYIHNNPNSVTLSSHPMITGSVILNEYSISIGYTHIYKWCEYWGCSIYDLDKVSSYTERYNTRSTMMRNDTTRNITYSPDGIIAANGAVMSIEGEFYSTNTNNSFMSGSGQTTGVYMHGGSNILSLDFNLLNASDEIRLPPKQLDKHLLSPYLWHLHTPQDSRIGYYIHLNVGSWMPIKSDKVYSTYTKLLTIDRIYPELSYLESDLNAMEFDEHKYVYDQLHTILSESVLPDDIKELSRDLDEKDYKYIETIYQFKKINYIIKNIPKSVTTCPLEMRGKCSIPSIDVMPSTLFQWELTDIMSTLLFDSESDDYKYISDRRNNTKKLLPYIHTDDKAVVMYLKFTGETHNDKPKYISYSEGELSRYDIHRIAMNMHIFIKDGIKLQEEYSTPVEIADYGMIRMSPVNGSVLKMIRNSIYNHRQETKISLEYKLKLYRESSDGNDVLPCTHELSEILETHRIKHKTDLIYLGKTLDHCLGQYTNSSNLFFRSETVCAEVDSTTLEIIQIYDKSDKVTELSSIVNEWLKDELDLHLINSHVRKVGESMVLIEDIRSHNNQSIISSIRDNIRTVSTFEMNLPNEGLRIADNTLM